MSVDIAAWLRNPDNGAHRNMLADVSPWSGGGVVTRYLSIQRCPAAGPYLPVITGFPVIQQEIQQPWGGAAFATIGDIEFNNADGLFDDWLFDRWSERQIVLRFGDRRWAKEDYLVFYTGSVAAIKSTDANRLVLELTDLHAKFDKPIQLDTVDDGTNGEVEIPLCYGYCYQVRPILIDSALHKYQVHDGRVDDCHTAVQLFIDGDHNSVPAFTEDNSTGILDLNADTGGVMTTDTKGAAPGGSWKSKPAEIFRLIAAEKADVSDPSEIDVPAFTAFDADKPVIGLYINNPMRRREAFDEIVRSFCAWYTTTTAGLLTIGMLVAPTAGASTLDLRMSRQEILEPIIVYQQEQPPRYKTRLGYARAWTRNTSTNPNINPPHREWFRRGFKIAEYEDPAAAAIQAEFLNATVPEVKETLITYQADAEDWAEHEQELFGVQRYYCEALASLAAFQVAIGDVVTLYDDKFNRYGFGAGRPVTVVGIQKMPQDGAVKLKGWF